MTTHSTKSQDESNKVVPFETFRTKRRPGSVDRDVVAVVTVTRFIGHKKIHAQVPVFADEVLGAGVTREELKTVVPELSELLADGAVEANAYLDRVAAAKAARPIGDFYPRL